MFWQPCGGAIIWLILMCFVVSSRGFECPQGPGCSGCNIIPNGEYEIVCRTTPTNSAFLIKYRPHSYVSITCINTPNWQNFHLGETAKIQHIDAIYFKMCELPTDSQLSAVVEKLVTENINELDFRSYDNLSLTLSKNSLKNFHEVKKLTLSSNSLTNVTDDLLSDLPNLRILNLQENNLNKLPINFLNIPSLEAIELSNNKLEVIEPWVFDKLEQLKLLNLWSNKITEIKPQSFDKLTLLQSIDLQNNKLTKLPVNIFARLSNLRGINLSRNNFTANSFPDNLFRDNKNLRDVKFFENKQNLTTLPKNFFGNLTELTTVTMRRNGLIHLPEDLFWGAINLNYLNIERNYLITLPLQFFRDCTNLTTLDLSFNDIQYLPDGIFSSLRKLTSLDLSKNHLTSITTNLLSGMSSLTTLNMEHNDIKFIDPHAMRTLQNLRIAKFSYNELTLKSIGFNTKSEFGLISPFEPVQSTIEELHLAYNNITDIFSDWRFATHLTKLNLKNNQLRFIRTVDLLFLSSQINIDLSSNAIETIWLTSRDFMFQTSPRNVIINFENNPIKCDCNLYNVLRFQEGRLHPSLQNSFDLRTKTLKCNGPGPYEGVSLKDLNSNTFLCAVEPTSRNDSCPSPCSCAVKPETNAFLIDCANKGLLHPPKIPKIPAEYQSLHVELNLSGNYLTTMPSMTQRGYNQVTVLSLADNNIENIPVENLSDNLEVLNLQSNNLTRMNLETLDFFINSTKLKTLVLDRNAWVCDCESRDFLRFIQTKRVNMPELQNVTCGLFAKPIFEMTPDELCPVMIEWIIGGCIGVALLGIIIGSIAAMYYRYQREIKVWLFAHQWCLCLITEDELDKDKLYDAFISYSHTDDEFVINHLVPKLEQGPNPFKLCVHYRDWLAGEWIPTQIARSVDDSRRTIVVLSPNFLESIWGRMEFRAAHKQALSEGRARLIVILYGDIGPTESLDPELKSYLTMNTYIKWGDPWFWEKLRYALPHPTDLTKNKVAKSSIFQRHSPKIQMGNDKSELIDTSGSSKTPSTTSSTPSYNTLNTVISMDDEINKNAINNTLTKELNETIKSLPQSAISSSNDDKFKCNGKSIMPQWTNV
ncbi:hypothetical protein PV325_013913 [Microctonus aethiopoides]|nr:hypothetical protein PV325_013913 [Microctonus aethiopoides]